MRVLAYADGLEYSGAEAAFARLVGALSRRDGVTITAATPPGRLERDLRHDGVEVDPLPAIPVRAGLTAFDPRLRRALAGLLRHQHFDLILANLPSAQAGTSGLGTGIPSAAYLHIPHSLAQAEFRLGALRDRIAGHRLRRADRIIVPAPGTRHWVTEQWGFPDGRVGWVPPPSRDPQPYARDEARAQLGLDPAAVLVGIVGRVSIKQKGHDVAIRALATAPLAEAGAELVLAGSGPDLDRVQALARAIGVSERVHMLGHLPEPDVLYGAVDLLAIPSRFEGLPLVALEALKLGVAGIASAVDGLSDVWPAEWLVPPGSSEALGRALAAVLGVAPEERRARVERRWRELAGVYDDSAELMLGELRATLTGHAIDNAAVS